MGEGVPLAVRERQREIFGYDDPWFVQYLRWLQALLHGDIGWSISQKRPALDVVLDALPNSLMLVLPGFLLAMALGMMLGVWQGLRARRTSDRLTGMLLFVLYSLPEFWLALLLLTAFSVTWPLLPSGGIVSDVHAYLPPLQQLTDRLRHLVLPTLVVALFDFATIARFQRNSFIDVLSQPHVRTALAGGLPRTRVIVRAWRASLLPVLTIGGILLPANVLGAVFIEQIFAWPGLGFTLLGAVLGRDYALVAACVIAGSVVIAISTALADLLREAADPRLRDTPSSMALPAAFDGSVRRA